MKKFKKQELTFGEEVGNCITHGIGAALSIAGLVMLIIISFQHGRAADVTGAMIFGISMFFLYMMSTMYHALTRKGGVVQKVFKILDHSAIYVLIAGTYTPFCLTMIGGTKGLLILAIQWTLAITGIVFKAVFYKKYAAVHLVIYLLMGWMIVLFIKSIYPLVSPTGIALLVSGGICYTIGVLFYALRLFKYHHMVWHLCVLGGTVCHFFMIYLYVLPR